jgi:dihydroorotate dehydrogenase (fumarate)/dihydroorotate dehydrogenase
MNGYRSFLRPILFRLDPEWCHDRTIRALEIAGSLRPLRTLIEARYSFTDPRLESEVCGLRFKNPIGLAAGFDKSGRAFEALAALGFGHIEIGSISADFSAGNPKPRLFRLPDERAIVVHYGVPNDGAATVASRLQSKERRATVGINIVKTNRGTNAPAESDDAVIEDYVRSVRILKDKGDYLNLNVSCPNSEGGRDFFGCPGNTRVLLSALAALDIRCPVFLKVTPPGGIRAIEALLADVEGIGFVSGFAFNLPPGKPAGLKTAARSLEGMPGAVSGKPIEKFFNAAIGELYRRMDRRRYRIIGVGGVFHAEDAYLKIRLGASLVQLLTGLVYEGPGVAKSINEGLCRLLERDGFARIGEAVGTLS